MWQQENFCVGGPPRLHVSGIFWPEAKGAPTSGTTPPCFVLFCFLFTFQLSVCLWWNDYHRGNVPTLKFVVVMAS